MRKPRHRWVIVLITDQASAAWSQNLSPGNLTQTLHWNYHALLFLMFHCADQLVGILREHTHGLGV